VGSILLDSTVIVGLLDADDALHPVATARIRALAGSTTLAASVISYAEVMTGAVRGHHDRELVDGFFDALIADLLPVDRAIAAHAATLRARNRALRIPDALILATAETDERIETVVSADGVWPKLKGVRSRIELLTP
jgi:hypothetical protein